MTGVIYSRGKLPSLRRRPVEIIAAVSAGTRFTVTAESPWAARVSRSRSRALALPGCPEVAFSGVACDGCVYSVTPLGGVFIDVSVCMFCALSVTFLRLVGGLLVAVSESLQRPPERLSAERVGAFRRMFLNVLLVVLGSRICMFRVCRKTCMYIFDLWFLWLSGGALVRVFRYVPDGVFVRRMPAVHTLNICCHMYVQRALLWRFHQVSAVT